MDLFWPLQLGEWSFGQKNVSKGRSPGGFSRQVNKGVMRKAGASTLSVQGGEPSQPAAFHSSRGGGFLCHRCFLGARVFEKVMLSLVLGR